MSVNMSLKTVYKNLNKRDHFKRDTQKGLLILALLILSNKSYQEVWTNLIGIFM